MEAMTSSSYLTPQEAGGIHQIKRALADLRHRKVIVEEMIDNLHFYSRIAPLAPGILPARKKRAGVIRPLPESN
jgi:hypothetical protein